MVMLWLSWRRSGRSRLFSIKMFLAIFLKKIEFYKHVFRVCIVNWRLSPHLLWYSSKNHCKSSMIKFFIMTRCFGFKSPVKTGWSLSTKIPNSSILRLSSGGEKYGNKFFYWQRLVHRHFSYPKKGSIFFIIIFFSQLLDSSLTAWILVLFLSLKTKSLKSLLPQSLCVK